MLFLGSRSLPPPNPLPLGGGTARWRFPIHDKLKIIYYIIIYNLYYIVEKCQCAVPPPSGRGLGGGRNREHKNIMKNTPPKKLKRHTLG